MEAKTGGWAVAELIEVDSAGDASNSQVAVDPRGNAVAVWQQSDGGRTNILANRFASAEGWGIAELIETADAGDASDPRVTVDSNGRSIAVWLQSDGTRVSVWSSRFE